MIFVILAPSKTLAQARTSTQQGTTHALITRPCGKKVQVMPEYIEREKIIFNILGLTIVDPAVAAYADAVVHQVQSVPAADVAPVRHGRWVDRIVDENEVIQPWMERYYCSECLEGGNQSWFKFCPNCGCRMDGG